MLFLIDQDVDAAVARMLRTHGHRCESAWSVKLSDSGDDDLTVWAHDHSAVLISTDVEFATRRRRNSIGWHIWLRCTDWEAAAVLETHLADVLDIVAARRDVVIRVSKDGIDPFEAWR